MRATTTVPVTHAVVACLPRARRRALSRRACTLLATLWLAGGTYPALAQIPPSDPGPSPAQSEGRPLEKAQEPAPVSPASVATTDRFDGDWTIAVDCPADTARSGAQGYAYDFPASVLNGRLFGSRGPQGAAGSIQVEGTIAPSGDALLQARGRIATPANAVGQAPAGTPYSYDLQAHFDATRGSGSRMQDRICHYAFTRR